MNWTSCGVSNMSWWKDVTNGTTDGGELPELPCLRRLLLAYCTVFANATRPNTPNQAKSPPSHVSSSPCACASILASCWRTFAVRARSVRSETLEIMIHPWQLGIVRDLDLRFEMTNLTIHRQPSTGWNWKWGMLLGTLRMLPVQLTT
jgi:hypothetical protein